VLCFGIDPPGGAAGSHIGARFSSQSRHPSLANRNFEIDAAR
jgi:hypothetical protein